MSILNLYLSGVGGQGIGLLAETLARTCIAAGYSVIGCDTHGLAQRGGSVVSQLRLGSGIHTPLVPKGQADIVISLERLEAFRAIQTMLKPAGRVIYYDTVYQPIHVRMGQYQYPSHEDLAAAVTAKNGTLTSVYLEDLPDPRMQNIALLGRVGAQNVIENVTVDLLERVLEESLPARIKAANLAIFKQAVTAS